VNLPGTNRVFVVRIQTARRDALSAAEGGDHHLVVREAAFGFDLEELCEVVDHVRVVATEPRVDDLMIRDASLFREDVLFTGGFVTSQRSQCVKGVTEGARRDEDDSTIALFDRRSDDLTNGFEVAWL